MQLECCGIEGPKDWDRNVYFNCSSEVVGSREACGVPFSCCKQKANVSEWLPQRNVDPSLDVYGILLKDDEYVENFLIIGLAVI